MRASVSAPRFLLAAHASSTLPAAADSALPNTQRAALNVKSILRNHRWFCFPLNDKDKCIAVAVLLINIQ